MPNFFFHFFVLENSLQMENFDQTMHICNTVQSLRSSSTDELVNPLLFENDFQRPWKIAKSAHFIIFENRNFRTVLPQKWFKNLTSVHLHLQILMHFRLGIRW